MRKAIPLDILESEISTIQKVLNDRVKPVSAYLFGSAAEGKMTDQSDFDLLLVMEDESECRSGQSAFAASRKLLPSRPFDVLWFTHAEFERKKDLGGVAFIAIRDGRKIV